MSDAIFDAKPFDEYRLIVEKEERNIEDKRIDKYMFFVGHKFAGYNPPVNLFDGKKGVVHFSTLKGSVCFPVRTMNSTAQLQECVKRVHEAQAIKDSHDRRMVLNNGVAIKLGILGWNAPVCQERRQEL